LNGNTSGDIGFEIGGVYAESPTITYSPLQGNEFAGRLLSPVSPITIILLSQSGWSIERLLLCCVQQINGLKNAPSATGPTPSYIPQYKEFQEASRLLRQLQMAGRLNFQIDIGQQEQQTLVLLERSMEENNQTVRELLDIAPGQTALRLSSNSVARKPDEIAIVGRSLLGVMFFLSNAVDVPPSHKERGLVIVTKGAQGEEFDWHTLTDSLLRVRSAAEPPPAAFVRVKYRDHWFYIDDADLNSKTTFQLLTYLFSLQAAGQKGPSPLLTLPVGR
jgi:hypothetical protein